jgi:hypothetical protein
MTSSNLNAEEAAFYRQNGYLLYKKQLFDKPQMEELTQIFEEHWISVGEKLNRELDTPHFRDERLLKFLLSDEVLDLVEPLIGPDIGLWSSHFMINSLPSGLRSIAAGRKTVVCGLYPEPITTVSRNMKKLTQLKICSN